LCNALGGKSTWVEFPSGCFNNGGEPIFRAPSSPPAACADFMLLDISPLRISRDYRLLFFGQIISAFGTAMSFVVVPVQVYQLTGSTLLVGLPPELYFASRVRPARVATMSISFAGSTGFDTCNWKPERRARVLSSALA
jgi:hypothetical protein